MKLSKNSLLFRMIFYNDIAMVMVSVTIALFMTFVAFKSIETKVVESIKDKVALISRSYGGDMLRARDEISQVVRNAFVLDTQFFGKNVDYTQQAKILKDRLIRKDVALYKDSDVALVDENGYILGESSSDGSTTPIDKEKFRENIYRGNRNKKTTYLFKHQGKIYARTVSKYEEKNKKEIFLVLTIPVNEGLLKRMEPVVGLLENDLVVLLVDDKYTGEKFKVDSESRIIRKKEVTKKLGKDYSYIYKKKDSNHEAYYVGLKDLYDFDDEYIGSIGVAIYYEPIEEMKIIISISVIVIILLFVGISTTVSAKIFDRLLSPLSKIVEAAQEVSSGNYDISVKPYGVDEMRTLSNSFNKMTEEIRNKNEEERSKKRKLVGTIKRIDSIEKILLNIQIENDMLTTVKDIMAALVSEVGLGYSRAMYFRYSRELDRVVGEFSIVNNRVKKEILSDKELAGVFKFQVEELEKLTKLIKIPFKGDNLIGKSLIEKRVISENDKGYKYNLGNDLFKSFGIDKFVIIPVYSEKRNYGCIVVDYFGKDSKVGEEDLELLTLLSLNISIRIRNRNIEAEKIDQERTITTGKLVDRFFKGRETSFEKMTTILEEMIKTSEESKFFKFQIEEIEKEIVKLRREREILTEYINVKKNEPLEIINLEEVISQVIAEVEESFEAKNINISSFINYSGYVVGNKSRLKRAILEVVKNAGESFENNDKKYNDDKKINIIVTKDKIADKIRINIIDNGIGMTEAELENIFDPFVGYNDAPGLGLAIVSRIIKDHYGVIKISSQKGDGTDVKITLNTYKEENL